MAFFDENVLLTNSTAQLLYKEIKDLPIIDYHCHLNDGEIASDRTFADIGELWLSADHYKWRAMRLCGIEEKYITGNASFKEKFLKFASVMPKLAGNPLYYFSHLELKIVFGINEPLNSNTAEKIWNEANSKIKGLSVKKLLELFKVEYIATTDDPCSELVNHGTYGKTVVRPTFRPDRVFELDNQYYESLSRVAGIEIHDLKSLKAALMLRLDFFVSKGCAISDHGFDFVPGYEVGEAEAAEIFAKREQADALDKHRFFCHMLGWLAGQYTNRGIVMQLHMGTMRNINSASLKAFGRDSGFDVFRSRVDTDALTSFLDRLNSQGNLPKTILYSHNKQATPALCALSGGFKDIRVGAAWWMNDTQNGIRQHLAEVADYAVLGTFLGMLTDSRSFVSYARFDFFRRILCDYLGNLVERGEYDLGGARALIMDICYNNITAFLAKA